MRGAPLIAIFPGLWQYLMTWTAELMTASFKRDALQSPKPGRVSLAAIGHPCVATLTTTTLPWDRFYKRLKISPKFGRERTRRFAVSIL